MIFYVHDFLNICLWHACFVDTIIDNHERLSTIAAAERNWWHSSLWGKAAWEFENYARNWWVTAKLLLTYCSCFPILMYLLSTTGSKRRQIIEVVKYLDERLKELDEEKEDLRKYQQLDKQRKSLEYTIYDKELQDAQQRLAKVSIFAWTCMILFSFSAGLFPSGFYCADLFDNLCLLRHEHELRPLIRLAYISAPCPFFISFAILHPSWW